ncbi:MAG: hypothetical protein K9K34_19330 [Desulfarculaceae bacterium]|nr:hypothetical protein [Desulfarculaceae bacterium]
MIGREMVTLQIEVPKYGLDILRQISDSIGKTEIPIEDLVENIVHQQILELLEISLDYGVEIQDVPYVEMFINDLRVLSNKYGFDPESFILGSLDVLHGQMG